LKSKGSELQEKIERFEPFTKKDAGDDTNQLLTNCKQLKYLAFLA